jgi:ketosteroid isomerase-like protein
MKRFYAIVILIFAASSVALNQTTEQKLSGRNEKIKQELIKLEEEWHNAYVKRDAAPLEKILAEEYIAVSGNGGSYSKAQTIEGLKNDTATYEYSTPYDMDFRFYDDAVVVIGRTKEKGKAQNGTEFTVEYRWTDVFVKKNGRWQCVAAQVVRIPPPKPKQ